MTKLIVPLLALAFAGCSMALLVVIAKLQNEKERRWDEISRSAWLENELEQSKAREKCSAESVLWYAEQLTKAEQDLKRYTFWFESCRNGNKVLQDRLSALLCPHNDHVWKDGFCVKCGRVKNG